MTATNEYYIVRVRKTNKWKEHSKHRNLDNAFINMEVQYHSGLDVRIYNGETIIKEAIHKTP